MKAKKIIPICNNYEFRRIYNRGKSYVSPLVVLYIMKNRSGNTRVGITASKKIGNAVKRNRSRRIIREAVLSLWSQIKPGYDLVLVARGKTPFVKSTDIEKSLHKLSKQANILRKEGKRESMEKQV